MRGSIFYPDEPTSRAVRPASTRGEQSFDWDDVVAAMHDIRVLARGLLAKEGEVISWSATALLDEALRRLHERHGRWHMETTWTSRAHFFGACCQAMKSALSDRRRQAMAAKRPRLVYVDNWLELSPEHLAFDYPTLSEQLAQAIEQIADVSSEQARLLECRFVLGFSTRETALAMGYSERHVRRLFAISIESLKARIAPDTSAMPTSR